MSRVVIDVFVAATVVVVAIAAIVDVVAANTNADVDVACSDADALPDAFDHAMYDDVDDADANANMLNAVRHLVGAHVSVDDANVVAVA